MFGAPGRHRSQAISSGCGRNGLTTPPLLPPTLDEWGLIVDVMNMDPMMDRQFEFEYTFEWVSSAEPVRPLWLDVDQCEDSEVEIPHGVYTDLHYNWNSTLTGLYAMKRGVAS